MFVLIVGCAPNFEVETLYSTLPNLLTEHIYNLFSRGKFARASIAKICDRITARATENYVIQGSRTSV